MFSVFLIIIFLSLSQTDILIYSFGDIFFSLANFEFTMVTVKCGLHFKIQKPCFYIRKLITDCSIFIDQVSSQIITINDGLKFPCAFCSKLDFLEHLLIYLKSVSTF